MSHVLAYNPLTWDFTLANWEPIKRIPRNSTALVSTKAVPYYEKEKLDAECVELKEFIRRIDALLTWSKNWDGYGSEKPKTKSIDNAREWGRYIYSLVTKENYEWRMPFISADEEGDVVFEWWYHDRKLTLDITKNSVSFTEIRDVDGVPKITMGNFAKANALSKFRWLIVGE